MKVHLRTFGCRANHYDSEQLRAMFGRADVEVVQTAGEADVAVFNSCAVTADAEADLAKVRETMLAVDGVEDVHDLHVWSITSGMHAMSAHVVVGGRDERRHSGEILADLHRLVHDRFGLDHLTIQVEPRDFQEIGCTTLAGC